MVIWSDQKGRVSLKLWRYIYRASARVLMHLSCQIVLRAQFCFVFFSFRLFLNGCETKKQNFNSPREFVDILFWLFFFVCFIFMKYTLRLYPRSDYCIFMRSRCYFPYSNSSFRFLFPFFYAYNISIRLNHLTFQVLLILFYFFFYHSLPVAMSNFVSFWINKLLTSISSETVTLLSVLRIRYVCMCTGMIVMMVEVLLLLWTHFEFERMRWYQFSFHWILFFFSFIMKIFHTKQCICYCAFSPWCNYVLVVSTNFLFCYCSPFTVN